MSKEASTGWTMIKCRAYTLGFIGGQTSVFVVAPGITPDEADGIIQNLHASTSTVYYRKGWSPLDYHRTVTIYDHKQIEEVSQFGIYKILKDSEGLRAIEMGYCAPYNGSWINYDPYAFARPEVSLKARLKVED